MSSLLKSILIYFLEKDKEQSWYRKEVLTPGHPVKILKSDSKWSLIEIRSGRYPECNPKRILVSCGWITEQ